MGSLKRREITGLSSRFLARHQKDTAHLHTARLPDLRKQEKAEAGLTLVYPAVHLRLCSETMQLAIRLLTQPALEDEGGVVAAEAEGVGQGDINLLLARVVRDEV
jgi:hypothetical protein